MMSQPPFAWRRIHVKRLTDFSLSTPSRVLWIATHQPLGRKPSTIRQKTIDNQTENHRPPDRKPSTIRQKTVDNQAETPNHWVSDPPSDGSLSCCRQAEFLICLELNLLLIWSLTCFNSLFEEDRSCAVRPTVSHFGNANRYGVAASRKCY